MGKKRSSAVFNGTAEVMKRTVSEARSRSCEFTGMPRLTSSTKRRVLVDFGGDWCTDCKILDINFKKPENAALLKDNYVLVHVNVGAKGIDENLDVGERYGIPLKKGVPALAVLGSDGKVIHAQKEGEFESMRSMDPKSVNEFLEKWRTR